MKVCRKCGDSKESEALPPNARMRDGLHSWCRACMALAARRWRERNAEKVQAYKESRRVKPRLWTAEDTARLRQQNRRVRETQPDLAAPHAQGV